MDLDALGRGLAAQGLALRGGFAPITADEVPQLGGGRPPGAVLMVGSIGAAFWRHVQSSPEASGPDPIDRWTRRVVGAIAAAHGALALYPFDGPPWHPFQRWARRADPRLSVSPLGILIHPQFGLWHALRAALLLAEALPAQEVEPGPSPCDSCAERPCLSTCPVAAFTPAGFDAGGCARHLGGMAGADCRGQGCLARLACPVGAAHRYPTDLHGHLLAVFAARRGRPGATPPPERAVPSRAGTAREAPPAASRPGRCSPP